MVALRPWREDDVPDRLMGFAEPLVQRFSWPSAAPYTEADARAYFATLEEARLAEHEGVLRSHLRFKGGRRDTVVYSLLPRELR